jgi:hypothetical protein
VAALVVFQLRVVEHQDKVMQVGLDIPQHKIMAAVAAAVL